MLFFKNYLFAYIIIIGILGLIITRNQPKSYWKTFPYFLIIVGVLDSFGTIIYDYGENYGKYYYLAFLIPIQILYYYWLLGKNISSKYKLHLWGSVIYVITILIELSTNNNEEFLFTSLSFIVGNIFLLACILQYFFRLSSSNKILNFYKEKMFWVSLGLLIFWMGSLLYYGLFNFLYNDYRNIFDLYFPIVLVFNYIMYTCFLISFIWGKAD